MSEEAQFLADLAKEKRVISDKRKNIDNNTKFTEKFQQYNNGWVASAFQQNEREIIIIPPKEISRPNPVPKYTDISPEPTEIGEKIDGTIPREKVQEFLDLKEDLSNLKAQKVTDVARPVVVYNYQYTKPEPLYKPTTSYISIEAKNFIPSTLKLKNRKVNGYFQLYDVTKADYASQPAYFHIDGQTMLFSQGSNKVCFFELPPKNTNIRLLYVVNILEDGKEEPHSLSLIKLFDDQGKPIPEHRYLPAAMFTITKPYITDALELAIHDSDQATESIDCTTSIHYHSKSKQSFSYQWEENNTKPLCVPLFPIPSYSPYPIITIRDIWTTLNLKSGKVYFKACVCEKPNYKKPEPLKIIINKSGSGLTDFYVSPMFNGNSKHAFPDFIPIVPTENILKCHLLIQFYHFEENSKIKEKAIDTAVIPLSCISGNNNTSVEVELFSEAGKVSKDANVTLQTPKKSEGLSLQITIPPFYFPPQNMATALTDNFDIPSLSGIDESYADLYIIPLFCRLIKKRDSKVLPTLVQLLITFGDGGRTSLRKWLFNHFDPQTIGDDFPTFYPEAIKAFCHEIIEGKIETTIIPDFSTSLPLILDIMQIVFSDGKLQSTAQDLITINNSLLDLICFLLTKDVDCNSITESLGLFFFHNLSDLGNEEIVRFVYIFLRTISKVRPIIAHPMSATRVQWIFLSPLSLSKHFLINMTNNMKPLSTNAMYSPYSKLTSQFLLSTQQCFGGRDPDTFALCAGFLARLLSNLDEICYSIRQRIAFALFPLIDLCSNHFESPLFMSNKRMQIALIPFVLFLIKNSEQKQLLSFFHSLSISFKCHFISFLKLTGKIIIDTLDVIKPTYECPQINLNLLDL
ncbi:hypothetical protein TVAG_160650, partial [Trichomonas vaginalis G3]